MCFVGAESATSRSMKASLSSFPYPRRKTSTRQDSRSGPRDVLFLIYAPRIVLRHVSTRIEQRFCAAAETSSILIGGWLHANWCAMPDHDRKLCSSGERPDSSSLAYSRVTLATALGEPSQRTYFLSNAWHFKFSKDPRVFFAKLIVLCAIQGFLTVDL